MRLSRLSVVVLGALCACTSQQAAQLPAPASPDVATQSKLQLAVGTATIGVAGGAAIRGLNVVATFRNASGNNATNLNTPTLTAPGGFNFGPFLGGGSTLAGFAPARYIALENVIANKIAAPTRASEERALSNGLGPFVGVFGYGLAADNLLSVDDTAIQAATAASGMTFCAGLGFSGTGVSDAFFYGGIPSAANAPLSNTVISTLTRSAELSEPLASGNAGGNTTCTCAAYCAPGGSPLNDPAFPTQFFGGPPAWPTPQGYGNYSYFVGYPSGFTEIPATPVAGTYALSVAWPTAADFSTSQSLTARAPLHATQGLPPIAPPTITLTGDGSASITLVVPPGLKETIVYIVASDCDLAGRYLTNGTYIDHYALITRNPGKQTLFVAGNLGPPSRTSGLPTHTFCTSADVAAYNAVVASNHTVGISQFGDVVQVQAAGFDYPAYEASYPFDVSQAPVIAGANGQADITTSYPIRSTFAIAAPAGS